ncbi:MAG: hypothetical protein IKN53_01085 [Oscillibacter sp.]|nr:hypothetical protein [Oscillibacter sp.]
MLRRKMTPAEPANDQQTQDRVAIELMKKQLRQQIAVLTATLAVMGIAGFAFVTHAWFAMNRDVTAQDSAISSETPSPSLFIRKGSDNTEAHATAVSSESTSALFPISTVNMSDWYYASAFSYNSREVEGDGYTYIVNDPIATAYTRIASFTDAAAGTYNNTYEGKTRTAYYRSDVNLYTTNGDLDVYLNATNPITVSYAENATEAKQLLNALRVGIVANGTMKFIYAPAAESGTGNSQGSAANTFYTISSGTLTAANSTVLTSLTDYTASLKAGSTVIYEAAQGHTSLGTATSAGLNVSVYVWLEGTDAQALFGLSDSDVKGINVTLNYVGVEAS